MIESFTFMSAIDPMLKIQNFFHPNYDWVITFVKSGPEVLTGSVRTLGGEYDQFSPNNTFHLTEPGKDRNLHAEFLTAEWNPARSPNSKTGVIFVRMQVLSSHSLDEKNEIKQLFSWKHDFDSEEFNVKRVKDHLGKLTEIADNVLTIESLGLLFVNEAIDSTYNVRCYSRLELPVDKQLRNQIVKAFP